VTATDLNTVRAYCTPLHRGLNEGDCLECDLLNAKHLAGEWQDQAAKFAAILEAAEAALRDAQTERDEARDKVLTHTEALLALTGERDRWRAVACNVKDGTAAAEAQVQQLKDAITEYLSSETAGGDPIGPQWYIDCNERTKGKHYPGKARLARAALADVPDKEEAP